MIIDFLYHITHLTVRLQKLIKQLNKNVVWLVAAAEADL